MLFVNVCYVCSCVRACVSVHVPLCVVLEIYVDYQISTCDNILAAKESGVVIIKGPSRSYS